MIERERAMPVVSHPPRSSARYNHNWGSYSRLDTVRHSYATTRSFYTSRIFLFIFSLYHKLSLKAPHRMQS